jgi:hypothetical protein
MNKAISYVKNNWWWIIIGGMMLAFSHEKIIDSLTGV